MFSSRYFRARYWAARLFQQTLPSAATVPAVAIPGRYLNNLLGRRRGLSNRVQRIRQVP